MFEGDIHDIRALTRTGTIPVQGPSRQPDEIGSGSAPRGGSKGARREADRHPIRRG